MVGTCAMKLNDHALLVARTGCLLTCLSSLLSSWSCPVSQIVIGCGSGSHILTAHSPTHGFVIGGLRNSILSLYLRPKTFLPSQSLAMQLASASWGHSHGKKLGAASDHRQWSTTLIPVSSRTECLQKGHGGSLDAILLQWHLQMTSCLTP